MVRDSHAVGGSVLSSISVTTKQVGLPTRDRMAISRVSPLRHAERAGHARQDALRDAKVEQQVVRGGAPLCDGFQNASLLLRLPQCAER